MTVSDMWPGHALEVDTKPGHGVPNQNICRQIGEPKDTIPGHEVDVDTIPGQRVKDSLPGQEVDVDTMPGQNPQRSRPSRTRDVFPGRLRLLRLCLVTFQILVLGQRETPEDDVVQKFLQRRPTTYRGVGGVHQLAHAVDDAAGHLGAGLMHRVLNAPAKPCGWHTRCPRAPSGDGPQAAARVQPGGPCAHSPRSLHAHDGRHRRGLRPPPDHVRCRP